MTKKQRRFFLILFFTFYTSQGASTVSAAWRPGWFPSWFHRCRRSGRGWYLSSQLAPRVLRNLGSPSRRLGTRFSADYHHSTFREQPCTAWKPVREELWSSQVPEFRWFRPSFRSVGFHVRAAATRSLRGKRNERLNCELRLSRWRMCRRKLFWRWGNEKKILI